MRHTWLILAVGCFTACSSVSAPESTPRSSPTPQDHDPVCAALQSGGQQTTEPVSVPTQGSRLRVLALGDFGDGGTDQAKVSKAMEEYLQEHADNPASFGLTLGDNFYEEGLREGERGIPWQRLWEDHYGHERLGILFFASLGNHDYSDFQPADELAYRSRSWCLPQRFYTFTAGPVQFFAIDTDPIVKRERVNQQLDWLDKALKDSHASWKIVYGHHPVFSNGDHGKDPELNVLREKLLPLLRNRVDVYLAGHDHDLQLLKPVDKVELLIAGAGGHNLRPLIRKPVPPEWGAAMVPGFAVVEATDQELVIQLMDTSRKALCTVRKDRAGVTRKDCP